MAISQGLRIVGTSMVIVATLISGCVSLDTTADYEDAMDLIEQRSGLRPEWNSPWSGAETVWDGESPLLVDQAVDIALRNNRSLRAELEVIASARADFVQSGLLPNPVLNASFGPAVGGESGTTLFTVGFIQQLTDLWLRPARKNAAAAALREQILGVSDEALRLVADVREVHARLLYSQRGLQLTKTHIELLDQSIESVRRRIAAGEATRLDLNRMRQLSVGLQADLAQQELQYKREQRSMLETLGLANASANWDVVAADTTSYEWFDQLTETDVIELATKQRLDVAAAQKAYSVSVHQLRLANLGSIPEVAVGAIYDRDDAARDTFGPLFDIEVPIFDTNKARVAKAASEFRRAQAVASAVRQRAMTEARQAWLDAQANADLAAFYRNRIVSLARDNLRLADQAFNAGQVDTTVVLETRRELIQGEFQLNELESRYALSLIELEYAVGGHLQSKDDSIAPTTSDEEGSLSTTHHSDEEEAAS